MLRFGPRLGMLMEMMNGVGMLSLPQNLIDNAGTVFEAFENSTDWTVNGAGAIAANNISEFKTGTQSVKFTSPTGTTASWFDKTITAVDLSDETKAIRLWIYAYDSNISTLRFYLGQGSVNTSYSKVLSLKTGWNLLHLKQSDFNLSDGSPSWANTFNFIRIRLVATAGNVSSVSFDDLRSGVVARPAVMFTFDDGFASVYGEAYSYMKTKKMRGTAYVITDNINAADNMTSAQLLEMDAAGWSIGNHTTNGLNFSGKTEQQISDALSGAKTVLDALGLTRASSHVAYPGGYYDATVLSAMNVLSMLSGANIGPVYERMPLDNWYYVDRTEQLDNALALATAQADVDAAISRGEICVFYGHKITESPANDLEFGISNFQSLVDYVLSKQIAVLTINDLYSLQSGSISIPRPW